VGSAIQDNEILKIYHLQSAASGFQKESAVLIGGKAHTAQDLGHAAEIYASIRKEYGGTGSRVRWSTPLAEFLDKEALELSSDVSPEEVIRLCSMAQVGLTEADYGIAETGSLVLESGPGRSRLPSPLPPMQVALLPENRILPSLISFTERYADPKESARLRDMACLTFISGPSRTADIEMTLTLGVHGPQALHVILIRDGSPIHVQ